MAELFPAEVWSMIGRHLCPIQAKRLARCCSVTRDGCAEVKYCQEVRETIRQRCITAFKRHDGSWRIPNRAYWCRVCSEPYKPVYHYLKANDGNSNGDGKTQR